MAAALRSTLTGIDPEMRYSLRVFDSGWMNRYCVNG